MSRRVRQKLAAEFKRIFARRFGKLFDKTFGDVTVVRIADRAPEAHWDARFRQRILDEKIRNRIFAVGLSFDGTFIDAVFHGTGEKPRHDRRADDAALPRDGPAVRVQTGNELAVSRGAVKIVLHIVFARPGDLHGRTGGFRNLDRFGNKILLGAATEAAPKKSSVYANLLRLQPGDLRASVLTESLKLRWRVNVATVGAHVGNAIHRLHRGVGEAGNFVSGFHSLSRAGKHRVGVAIFPRDGAGLFSSSKIELSNGVAGVCGVGAFVPGDLQCAPALHRGPGVVRDDGNSGRNLQNLLYAANGFRFRTVKAFHFAAEDRTPRHDRTLDIRQAHVDAEGRLAVDLCGRVQPLHGFAYIFVIFRVLQ